MGGGGGWGSHCVKQRVLTRLWRFRHLNIVGCLLKKKALKGVDTGTPGPPQLRPCSYLLMPFYNFKSRKV